MTYFDRSCAGPENNQEFWITLNPVEEGKTLIHIDCKNSKGASFSYDMPGITMENLLARYTELINSLRESQEVPPRPDYEHVYSDEKVIRLYNAGEIAKTNYEKWESNKTKYPIGDWQCAYCNYKTLCKKQQETLA